jgi:DNA-binding CsgD family transcriptional regulator
MVSKVESMLGEILARLEAVEKAVVGPSARVAKSSAEAVLREKLDRLTIKRHAVLTATLGGVGYQELAKIMGCDVTTIKLHLKSAMMLLDIASRSTLLATHKAILDPIPDKEYESRYGVSKRWWLEQKHDLMEVLTSTKPAANQHTRVI